jgi:Fe-S oxidoreductase
VADETLFTNGLRDQRLASGIATQQELAERADLDPEWYSKLEAGKVLPTAEQLERLTAALGDIPPAALYGLGYRAVIPGALDLLNGESPATTYRQFADQGHVLLHRDEVAWFDRQPGPDHHPDVFLNLSCSTQQVPHLLLDTVAVAEKLGVSFVAAAGSVACCGSLFNNTGQVETAERVAQQRLRRSLGWGTKVHVNFCSSCQATTTTAAARRRHVDGVEHPVREVQLYTYLEERLRELGDRVPWKRRMPCRVLVEGHPAASDPHREAQEAMARLLALIPGVQVVGLYDGKSEESPCTAHGRFELGWTEPEWLRQQDDPEHVRAHRDRLAKYVRSRGADTVSNQHQNCHLAWSRYISDRLSVRHAVSILADALDCAHPDRRQAAIRLGDPEAFMEQTRPNWQSWGISEARARELSAAISNPTYADAAAHCSCGGGGRCRENLISIDVLTGSSRPA